MNIKRNIVLAVLSLIPFVTHAEELIRISNGKLALCQDLERGGAISHIYVGDNNRNLVNIYDEGRYIQQSYYAGKRIDRQHEGQSPQWSPWNWNPIQGGNFARCGAKIMRHDKTDTTIYIAAVPMLWDMADKEANALMEQWTELHGNFVKVRNRITVNHIDSIYMPGTRNDQEIPAVYPISSLKNLHIYLGDRPWQNDTVSTVPVKELSKDFSSFWGSYPKAPEKWMAFTDDSGFGMGVYSPRAQRFLAGRYTSDTAGEEKSVATSYIAPLMSAQLNPGDVLEYEYYILLGDLIDIRSMIYGIRNAE